MRFVNWLTGWNNAQLLSDNALEASQMPSGLRNCEIIGGPLDGRRKWALVGCGRASFVWHDKSAGVFHSYFYHAGAWHYRGAATTV